MPPALTDFLRLESSAIIGCLAAAVIYRFLTGRIKTKGLLETKDGTGRLSAARVQLLLITLGTAFSYLLGVLAHRNRLPDIPRATILILGGSHTYYLGVKSLRSLNIISQFLKR